MALGTFWGMDWLRRSRSLAGLLLGLRTDLHMGCWEVSGCDADTQSNRTGLRRVVAVWWSAGALSDVIVRSPPLFPGWLKSCVPVGCGVRVVEVHIFRARRAGPRA